jgi:uncharacterized membrane protein YdbT with pleckstrin-like domain
MPYPEKLLNEDEEIVEHLHPHWLTLVPAILAFLAICALSGLGYALLPEGQDNQTVRQGLLLAMLALALVLLIWLTLAPIIRWRCTHYVITARRVLIRRGVFTHTGRDITLGRISDVAYEQSLWDRIFRSGTLHIESAGENGQETLVNMPRANDVQQTLNRLIEADTRRREYPRSSQGY